MKPIEERAGDFAHTYELLDDGGCEKCAMQVARECFAAGARSEHEELTRWHDPKDLPKRYKDVLLKIQLVEYGKPIYSIGYWSGYYFGNTLGHPGKVIGWREIHE